jgi:hypothetical protein
MKQIKAWSCSLFKDEGFYEKMAFHVYLVGNVDFVWKMFDSAIWKVWSRFAFHVKFDPNNYRYYENMLQTKIYTWNCATHISNNSFNPCLRMMVRNVGFPYPPLLKCVVTKTSFKSKMTWNGLTSTTSKWIIQESTPKVDGISSILSSTKVHEFGYSIFPTSLRNDVAIT